MHALSQIANTAHAANMGSIVNSRHGKPINRLIPTMTKVFLSKIKRSSVKWAIKTKSPNTHHCARSTGTDRREKFGVISLQQLNGNIDKATEQTSHQAGKNIQTQIIESAKKAVQPHCRKYRAPTYCIGSGQKLGGWVLKRLKA